MEKRAEARAAESFGERHPEIEVMEAVYHSPRGRGVHGVCLYVRLPLGPEGLVMWEAVL